MIAGVPNVASETVTIVLWVMSALIGFVTAMGFYWFSKISNKADHNENELIRLKERQLSEGKLTTIIENAVEVSMLKFENKYLVKDLDKG